jgi:hypothetical protein
MNREAFEALAERLEKIQQHHSWPELGEAAAALRQASSQGEPTAVVVTWDEAHTRIVAVTRQDCDGQIVKVIAEAPASSQGEPVAWILRTGHGNRIIEGASNPYPEATWNGEPAWKPLYAAPPRSTEWAEALGKLIEMADEVYQSHRDPESADYNECEKEQCMWCEEVEKARAALEK